MTAAPSTPRHWLGHFCVVIGIILLAVIPRFFQLASIPHGLNWDETAYAYNALSLMKTGKDEWGMSWPIFLKSFGEYKPALLSYALIPLFQVFGTSEAVVRSVTAGLGAIAVGITYLLVYQLTHSRRVAIITTLTLAITPWHIHFSRVALDPGVAHPLMIVGVWLWLLPKQWQKSIGAVFLILSMYAYNAERVFVPLLIISWLILERVWLRQVEWRKLWLPLGIFLLGATWILGVSAFGAAGTRARTVGWFGSSDIDQHVIEMRYRYQLVGLPTLSTSVSRFYETSAAIVQQYFLYWRPDFLFFSKGGVNASPILGFPERGNLLEVFLPFALIGAIVTIRRNHPADRFFGLWLLLAPIPGALTTDGPHSGRGLLMLPALNYFVAVGIIEVIRWCTKRFSGLQFIEVLVTGLVTLIITLSFLSFTAHYLTFYPEESQYSYQGYFKEVSTWLKYNRSFDQRLIFTSRYDPQTLLFYAWYAKIDPTLIQAARHDGGSPYYLDSFGNTMLLDTNQLSSWCAVNIPNSLVILHPEEAEGIPYRTVATFSFFNRFQSSQPAFLVYDTTQFNLANAPKDCPSIEVLRN